MSTKNHSSRQIMVQSPSTVDQLHVCEEQQLWLLLDEAGRACSKCHRTSWRMAETIMRGHVLCANIRCANPKCDNLRRWLGSSIVGDRYTVNARCVGWWRAERQISRPAFIVTFMRPAYQGGYRSWASYNNKVSVQVYALCMRQSSSHACKIVPFFVLILYIQDGTCLHYHGCIASTIQGNVQGSKDGPCRRPLHCRK